MAIKESRELVIEASPQEILDVIADFEAMPEWSDPHQSAEIVETGEDGRPKVVKMKVKTAGITDEQVIAYTWSENKVSWSLVSSNAQKSQDGSYTLIPKGENTLLKMELSVETSVPLPGFVVKKAVAGNAEKGTKDLRLRVLKVKKGK